MAELGDGYNGNAKELNLYQFHHNSKAGGVGYSPSPTPPNTPKVKRKEIQLATPLVSQSEMIDDLAERTGWSKSDVKSFLTHFDDFVAEYVAHGYRVKFAGIVVGAVVAAKRKARMGRNPRTGEAVKIPAKPASAKLKAKVVKPLKDVVLPSVKKLQSMS